MELVKCDWREEREKKMREDNNYIWERGMGTGAQDGARIVEKICSEKTWNDRQYPIPPYRRSKTHIAVHASI